MNILHLAYTDAILGAEKIIYYLSKYARDKGHNVTICVPARGPFYDFLTEKGFRVVILPVTKTYHVFQVFKLLRIIKENKIDVIHTHGYTVDLVARLAMMFKKTPLSLSTIHLIYNFRNNPEKNLLLKLKYEYYWRLNRWSSRYNDVIVAVSGAVRKAYIENGVPADKVVTIYNGIDIREREKAGDLPALAFLKDKACLLIGMAGRIVRQKGHKEFLEAAALLKKKHKNLKFVIAGKSLLKGDPFADSLSGLIEENGLKEDVVFTGFLSDIYSFYRYIDIFCMPSYAEPFATVILESMNAGVPVAASASGGVPEVIEDGVSGLLFTPKNPVSIAEALDKLIKDPELRKKISENGRKKIEKLFAYEVMGEKILNLYQSRLSAPQK